MESRPGPTIVRVISRLNVGGPSIQAILMTDAFRARGYRALLLAGEVPDGERSMEYLASRKRAAITRIDSMSRRISLLRDLWALGRILSILLREKPTVVHTHTAKAGLLGRIAAILVGVPVRVHTFHGHVFEGYFSPAITRFFIAIERALAGHTDRIIAVSERQRWELVHRFRIAGEEKVVTVPLGFELEPFLDANADGASFRREAGCARGCALVAWIGRLAPIKRPALFVQAAAAVRRCSSSSRFVIVGDGELWSATQSAVNSSGLDKAFRLISSRADMPSVYAALDLLVLTSQNEGTPLVLLEAMASGKPFVATDVGGIADLMVGPPRQMSGFRVFSNGILADSAAGAIADAVLYLLDRAEIRREMGKAGRNFVAKQYSHERLADDLEQLYRQLALSKERAGTHPSAWPESPSRRDCLPGQGNLERLAETEPRFSRG
jgi:glycosyltransferase involved in cell wall biosynthesis